MFPLFSFSILIFYLFDTIVENLTLLDFFPRFGSMMRNPYLCALYRYVFISFHAVILIATPFYTIYEEMCLDVECFTAYSYETVQRQYSQHLMETHQRPDLKLFAFGRRFAWWTSRVTAASLFRWNDHSDVMSLTRMSVPSLHILWLYHHEYSFPMRKRAEWGDTSSSLSSSH